MQQKNSQGRRLKKLKYIISLKSIILHSATFFFDLRKYNKENSILYFLNQFIVFWLRLDSEIG